MSAARNLIAEAEALGVRIYLRDGAVKVSYQGARPADLLMRLRVEKEEIALQLFSTSGAMRASPERRLPETNYCACGKIAILGLGWFLRTPERARWYCAECFPRRGV